MMHPYESFPLINEESDPDADLCLAPESKEEKKGATFVERIYQFSILFQLLPVQNEKWSLFCQIHGRPASPSYFICMRSLTSNIRLWISKTSETVS
jgi:hypothetical protein